MTAPAPEPADSFGYGRKSVVVVFVSGDSRNFTVTVDDLVRRSDRAVVLAAAKPDTLEMFGGLGAEVIVVPTVQEAVSVVWKQRGSDVFVVSDAALVPPDAIERGEAILAADLRNATVSFFSNDAGLLSFPTNSPTPMMPPGFDHVSLSKRIREADPTPTPVPYAAGAAVLVSHVALAAVGGFDDVADGVSFDACLADFSLRCRERGLVDLLDPGTCVFRPPVAGRELHRPVMSVPDRIWLTQRHPQLVGAFERELVTTDTPLSMVTRVARAHAFGIRVLIDDATLGPLETGAQITTLAIIDALAKHEGVAEVGVALSSHIPAYARAVLGQPKIRPALRVGSNYGELSGYDVLHRTAQPDRDFDVDGARTAAGRVVVSILDLIAYRAGSYHATTDEWLDYRAVLRESARRADGVTTISEDVASVLQQERFPVDRDRVFPILYGTEHLGGHEPSMFPAELADGDRLAGEFLVCLGTDYAHKNRDLAIGVHTELTRRGHHLTLILAGPSVPFGGSRNAERQRLESDGDVIFLPNVSSRERNWLFRHAAAVLYPTSAEGFGLVPFEAARFGSPTITVGFGPLLETSPEVPVVASSWDPREMADCVERLLRDPVLRREQVSATLVAADRYSWHRTAEAFIRMYLALLARPAR
jgi:glycosyltransferase involved in cell wall biosynthesis